MHKGERGRLQGGPYDGLTFSTNDRFWYAAAQDRLPEPAQRVYVSPDGELRFWFTGAVVMRNPNGPPLDRYDLDTEDAGWLYTHVNEGTKGQST